MKHCYEHAWEYEYDMDIEETFDPPQSPWECARCGSRDWDSPFSDCFVCAPNKPTNEHETMNNTSWERRQSLKPASEMRHDLLLARLAYQDRRNENAGRQTRLVGYVMLISIASILTGSLLLLLK